MSKKIVEGGCRGMYTSYDWLQGSFEYTVLYFANYLCTKMASRQKLLAGARCSMTPLASS